MQNDRYKLRDENNKLLDKPFFKSDLKLTTPYNRRDARRGIYSYSGVKDLDIKLNPKSDQAPVERIVNDLDRPPRQSQRRRPSVRLPQRPATAENREINVPPPEPRAPRRSKKKYKIDDFQIGDLVDVRYEDARNVYDLKTDRWVYKESPLFEKAKIIDIDENENNQFPLYIDYGTAYEGDDRYDFVKMSMIKKIYK